MWCAPRTGGVHRVARCAASPAPRAARQTRRAAHGGGDGKWAQVRELRAARAGRAERADPRACSPACGGSIRCSARRGGAVMSGGSGKRAAEARRIDEGQRADALVAGTSAPAPASPKPKRIKSSKMSLTRSFARVLPRSGDEEGLRTPATELLRPPPDESPAPSGAPDRMETDEQKEASEDPVTPRDVRKTAPLCGRARALGALPFTPSVLVCRADQAIIVNLKPHAPARPLEARAARHNSQVCFCQRRVGASRARALCLGGDLSRVVRPCFNSWYCRVRRRAVPCPHAPRGKWPCKACCCRNGSMPAFALGP